DKKAVLQVDPSNGNRTIVTAAIGTGPNGVCSPNDLCPVFLRGVAGESAQTLVVVDPLFNFANPLFDPIFLNDAVYLSFGNRQNDPTNCDPGFSQGTFDRLQDLEGPLLGTFGGVLRVDLTRSGKRSVLSDVTTGGPRFVHPLSLVVDRNGDPVVLDIFFGY